ncbi:FYN-binding protein [Camelus ferus]|nr:FYN-binding protein [Camelus ferus]
MRYPAVPDGKADVKSLMARFNTGGNLTEEVSANSRPFKVTGQNSPTGVQAKKNLFGYQGNASSPAGPSNVSKFGSPKPPLGVKPTLEDKPDKELRPPFMKPPGVGPRSGPQAGSAAKDPEAKAGFPKPVGLKPANLPKEDSKPAFPRPPGNKPSLHSVNQDPDFKPPGPKPGSHPPAQENEPEQVFPKLAGIKGRFTSASQDLDPKPLFPKPVFGQKPASGTDDSQEVEGPSKTAAAQKGPPAALGAKSKPGPLKPAREDPESKEHGGETSSSPFPGVVLKPAACRGAPGLPRNAEEKREERRMDAAKNVFLSKMNQEESASGAPPAKFPKTPSKLTTTGPWGQGQEKERGDKTPATPRQKPLPPLFTLGPPPPKPSRPPHVDLTKFQKAASGNKALLMKTIKIMSCTLMLTGPIQVIHQAKACCDVKGGKNELSFKQGEQIEIIRITDNPEGKWLGRTARGSYGYIKTTAVEIDYDSLKRKKNSLGALSSRPTEDDQEVYDDVAEQADASRCLLVPCTLYWLFPVSSGKIFTPNSNEGMFPPPPDDDIYDGIEEEDAADSLGAKAKSEEKDLKKLKKQEKEEKDFRKKFKMVMSFGVTWWTIDDPCGRFCLSDASVTRSPKLKTQKSLCFCSFTLHVQ